MVYCTIFFFTLICIHFNHIGTKKKKKQEEAIKEYQFLIGVRDREKYTFEK